MNPDDTQLANKYQQKTDKAHILDNPDTYIGSVEEVDTDMWILDNATEKIVQKNIRYIPGLYKLFDEGIVNCRDHVIRMTQAIATGQPNSLPVTYIDVTIEEATGAVTMTNDGNGIDVAMHPEYNVWIPELIFGHLRTSTNYDKTEKKIVGGKNGFGFKLVLIWSVYGSVETVDHVRGLKYVQTFRNNLDVIDPPVVTKYSGKKPYTKITFVPDYARLGIAGLAPDMLALLKKRVYDITAVTEKTLKVKYNSTLIPVKHFQQYIELYIGGDAAKVYEHSENGRWEYAAALAPAHEFTQVSFVNGIHTSKGGKHVEYILNQITRKMGDLIEKKKKVKVNANAIKEQLILFIRCDIENPAFDSQTKDFMNTPSSKFGSTCTVSDKFIEKLAKMGVMDAACAIAEIKETKAAKKTDGSKTRSIRGIPKLEDANWAGTEKSSQCTLILCEGDSAKAGIVSGLSSEDRNTIGIYPMKGKILNVRGETTPRIMQNNEICEIKKILGLETDREYTGMADVDKYLRYSRVLFMTDQDLDGSHIKGLGINLFESVWPSLTKIPGFIGFMNTPILKARKGSLEELLFYNTGEYESWKTANPDTQKTWHIKYYKGLGTSTGKEFREYFKHKKMVGFTHTGAPSENAIDMVFHKKRADDRKVWLEDYNRDLYLDTNQDKVTYEEFIHKELIHFSKYDCDRSIPNLMDGLKISLRKILYGAFKKNLHQEIKVAQFSGYVSEHSGYHHGEASLNATIKGMAQTFVGSNNINLFVPCGQFGTRLEGGRDAGSERYIYTHLTPITRAIFPRQDDAILRYLDDDGQLVEPLFYAPILPMVLVNGAKGIGTGFSTDILSYNPRDLIAYLRGKLAVEGASEFQGLPYYEGFQGRIERIGDNRFLVVGKYEKIGPDTIRITELPVGTWNGEFKEMLEGLLDNAPDKNGKKPAPVLKDYANMSKDTTVDFTVTLCKGKLEEWEAISGDTPWTNGVHKHLKLMTTLSSGNMHLFNAQDKLKKYASVTEIIDDYFVTRLALYQTRKDHLIVALQKIIRVVSNKVRYIQEILAGSIDLRHQKRDAIVALLRSKKYDAIEEGDSGGDGYKYLIKMPMDSVTEENVKKLMEEDDEKQKELVDIQNTSPQQMWLRELDHLETEYAKFKDERERLQAGEDEPPTTIQKKKRKVLKP